jgi:uncharacterized small protein (DUF1192 family)
MTSFGKKIIGAFLEVPSNDRTDDRHSGDRTYDRRSGDRTNDRSAGDRTNDGRASDRTDDRFAGYFDKLLGEANIPGPDYYEFARMVAAMHAIPDEAARYNAAFAGLQVQGLDKQRLLDTAAEYLKVLATDAEQFEATVEASYEEKVRGKETEAKQIGTRIQALSQEIMQLQQRIGTLQEEVKTGKDKLAGSSSAYSAGSKGRQGEIRRDMEKIDQYIH